MVALVASPDRAQGGRCRLHVEVNSTELWWSALFVFIPCKVSAPAAPPPFSPTQRRARAHTHACSLPLLSFLFSVPQLSLSVVRGHSPNFSDAELTGKSFMLITVADLFSLAYFLSSYTFVLPLVCVCVWVSFGVKVNGNNTHLGYSITVLCVCLKFALSRQLN